MTLLHFHTALLELLDWDEEAVEEAIKRVVEIALEISSDGTSVNERLLKKRLSDEYSERVSASLLDFFKATSAFEKEFLEADDQIGEEL